MRENHAGLNMILWEHAQISTRIFYHAKKFSQDPLKMPSTSYILDIQIFIKITPGLIPKHSKDVVDVVEDYTKREIDKIVEHKKTHRLNLKFVHHLS